jgi:predicted ArsR family transcriptional regulator
LDLPEQNGEDRMTKQIKPKTKKAQLIQMLTRKAGADITTISDKLSWQTHTTRAALSGLRKAGYAVVGEKPGEGKATRYWISATSTEPAGAETTNAG